MQADKDFSVISPNETRDIAFDFRGDVFPLDETEVLTAATCSIEVDSLDPGATLDASPSTRLDGAEAIVDNGYGETDLAVVQRITGCVAGNKYKVICLATTSRGQHLELWAYLPCKDP